MTDTTDTTVKELLELVAKARKMIQDNSQEAGKWQERAATALSRAKMTVEPVERESSGRNTEEFDSRCKCPSCGAQTLWYQENVPTIRELIDVRDNTVWVGEDEDLSWEMSFVGCISCSTCSTEFPLPEGHSVEWTAADYVSSYGQDALADARRGRAGSSLAQ